MASTIYVDVEDQCLDVENIQAPPAGWLLEVHHALENPKEFDMVSIPKVPKSLRTPAADFTPVEWCFGLHNREALHTGGSERFKIRAASAFGLKGDEWDEFCSDVVDNPEGLLKTYGVQSLDDVVTHISWRELKCLVTLDALFLVLLLDWSFDGPFTNSSALRNFFQPSWLSLVVRDFCLVENQIPMALLRKVIKKCFRHIGDHEVTEDQEEELLDTMLKEAVRILFPLRPQLDNSEHVFIKNYPQGKLGRCEHILDCLHQVVCGPHAVLQEENDDSKIITIGSATTLKAVGIKIKTYVGTLDNTSFEKGVLTLPLLPMDENTVAVFRNIAWFEFFEGEVCTFLDYLILMSDLIVTPADVNLLIQCKVIQKTVHTKVCENWSSLNEGFIASNPSPRFYKLKVDVNKHCQSKIKVFSAEFTRLFCSKPWLVLSLITVTFVTLATGIQTYVAVIGSNRMEPHFPH